MSTHYWNTEHCKIYVYIDLETSVNKRHSTFPWCLSLKRSDSWFHSDSLQEEQLGAHWSGLSWGRIMTGTILPVAHFGWLCLDALDVWWLDKTVGHRTSDLREVTGRRWGVLWGQSEVCVFKQRKAEHHYEAIAKWKRNMGNSAILLKYSELCFIFTTHLLVGSHHSQHSWRNKMYMLTLRLLFPSLGHCGFLYVC